MDMTNVYEQWPANHKNDKNPGEKMCYVGLLEYDYGYHYDHNGSERGSCYGRQGFGHRIQEMYRCI